MTPPQLVGSSSLCDVYWHIVLPGDRHVLQTSDVLSPIDPVQWLEVVLGRSAAKSQAELEEWVNATSQPGPAGTQNAYVYSAVPVSIELVNAALCGCWYSPRLAECCSSRLLGSICRQLVDLGSRSLWRLPWPGWRSRFRFKRCSWDRPRFWGWRCQYSRSYCVGGASRSKTSSRRRRRLAAPISACALLRTDSYYVPLPNSTPKRFPPIGQPVNERHADDSFGHSGIRSMRVSGQTLLRRRTIVAAIVALFIFTWTTPRANVTSRAQVFRRVLVPAESPEEWPRDEKPFCPSSQASSKNG